MEGHACCGEVLSSDLTLGYGALNWIYYFSASNRLNHRIWRVVIYHVWH